MVVHPANVPQQTKQLFLGVIGVFLPAAQTMVNFVLIPNNLIWSTHSLLASFLAFDFEILFTSQMATAGNGIFQIGYWEDCIVVAVGVSKYPK